MSEFNALSFFTIFITLYFIFMVPLGGANIFVQDFQVEEDDFSIKPDFAERQGNYIMLRNDSINYTNIDFVPESNLSGQTFEVEGEDGYAIRSDNDSEPANIFYSVSSDAEQFVTYSTNAPILFDNDIVFGAFNGSAPNPSSYTADDCSDFQNDAYYWDYTDAERIYGDDTNLLGTDYVGLCFLDGSDETVYTLEQVLDLGDTGRFLGQFSAWASSAFGSIGALLQIVLKMPWYLNIPFGLYISYLLIKVLSLL